MTYNPELYIHDLDRKAFDALNMFPKLVKLKEAYMANFDEKVAKIKFMSSAIRLNENQMPEIYQLLPPICEKLGIDVPELYYIRNKMMNAATAGVTAPYIYVTSELVKKLSPEQISGVLAHECGHIACKHNLYHQMAYQILMGVEMTPLGSIPVLGRFLTPALFNSLMFWERCSELSADRAAVLCEGNADIFIDALLRLHGYKNINREEFLKQAIDLRNFINESKSNEAIEQFIIRGESHPRMATRICECSEWSHSEQFVGILNGTYTLEARKEEEQDHEEEDVVAAEVSVEVTGAG